MKAFLHTVQGLIGIRCRKTTLHEGFRVACWKAPGHTRSRFARRRQHRDPFDKVSWSA